MSVQVGEGHIDIEPRIDDTNFVRQSRALTQAAERQWGMYAKNASRAMRETDQQFSSHINQQISSFQALDRQRQKSLSDQRAAVNRNIADITRQTNAARKMHESDRAAGAKAAADYERSQMAAFDRMVIGHNNAVTQMGRDREKVLIRTDQDIDRHSHRWSHTLAGTFNNAIDAAMSTMPGRLEHILTKTGPIGLIIGAALAGAITIALPAVGAAVSGAFFAALGGVFTLGAAAFAAKLHQEKGKWVIGDADVAAAGAHVGQVFTKSFLENPARNDMAKALADQVNSVADALERWAPSIISILNAGSKFFAPITGGIIGMLDNLLPAMDRLANSPFMADLIQITADGLKEIGEAFAISFDRFLADPQAMDGAKRGLQDLFDLLAGTIKLMFDMLRGLSSFWEQLNNDPDGPGPLVSKIQIIRDTWQQVKEILDQIVGLGDKLNKIKPPNGGNAAGVTTTGDLGTQFHGHGAFGGMTTPGQEQGGAAGEMSEAQRQLKGINDLLHGNLPEETKAKWGPIFRDFVHDWNEEMGVARRNWDAFTLGVSQRWTGMMESIKGAWNAGWGFVKMVATTIWTDIVNVATSIWGTITSIFTSIVSTITTAWSTAYEWTVSIWSSIFTSVWGWLQSLWDTVTGFFVSIWQTIHDWWTNAWNSTVEITSGIWGTVVSWLSSVWDQVNQWFGSVWATISGWWDSIWNTTSERTSAIWTTIDGWLHNVYDTFVSIWHSVGDFMTGAWDGIRSTVGDGINNVIDIINKGVDKINELLSKIGIDKKIPSLDRIDVGGGGHLTNRVPTSAMAHGGHVRGPGTSTSDSIPAVLSNGEFVIKASSARRLGYQNLSYMNSLGRVPGFAMGGRVDAGNEGLLQEHANHLHVAMQQGSAYIIALAAASGLPFDVGSTFRAGATTDSGGQSWHATDQAVDFMGYNQDALANYFMAIPGVLELIHRSAIQDYTIFGGKPGSGGGASSFLIDVLTKGIDSFLNPIIDGMRGEMPDSLPGWIGGGALGFLKDGVVKMVDDFLSTFREAMSGGGGGGGGAQQWSGVASAALARLGLPGTWLGPLLTLIDRESGGDPRSINTYDSNAAMGDPSRGLMQTIGSTFEAHRDPSLPDDIYDPLANITAGLRYIVARYGSIFNVQQAVGATPAGYDNGGPWQPGTYGYNASGSTEMVLNASQARALENRIAGDGNGCSPTIIVMVDGVEVAYKAMVEENSHQISRSLRGGKR